LITAFFNTEITYRVQYNTTEHQLGVNDWGAYLRVKVMRVYVSVSVLMSTLAFARGHQHPNGNSEKRPLLLK